MSNSNLPQNINSTDPWEFDHTEHQSSIFNKLGNKLGSVFLSTKKTVKSKYLEVTKGINQKIDEEDSRIQAEIYSHLEAQAEEFEEIFKMKKKKWLMISTILIFIAFIAGSVIATLNPITIG